MAQRTVQDAKAWLEAHATVLNSEAYGTFQREIRTVEGRHVAHAMEIVRSEAVAYAEQHKELLTDGCGIRDDYEQLAKDAATGRLSASEYRQRLNELDNAVPRFTQRSERLAQKVKTVEDIESDPVAFTDRIFDKNTALQKPDFSF